MKKSTDLYPPFKELSGTVIYDPTEDIRMTQLSENIFNADGTINRGNVYYLDTLELVTKTAYSLAHDHILDIGKDRVLQAKYATSKDGLAGFILNISAVKYVLYKLYKKPPVTKIESSKLTTVAIAVAASLNGRKFKYGEFNHHNSLLSRCSEKRLKITELIIEKSNVEQLAGLVTRNNYEMMYGFDNERYLAHQLVSVFQSRLEAQRRIDYILQELNEQIGKKKVTPTHLGYIDVLIYCAVYDWYYRNKYSISNDPFSSVKDWPELISQLGKSVCEPDSHEVDLYTDGNYQYETHEIFEISPDQKFSLTEFKAHIKNMFANEYEITDARLRKFYRDVGINKINIESKMYSLSDFCFLVDAIQNSPRISSEAGEIQKDLNKLYKLAKWRILASTGMV